MATTGKSVREFALIGFLLLAVLFGMNIMSFIFGNLGTVSADIFDPVTATVVNESGLTINTTTSTISVASDVGFLGGFTIITAINGSDSTVIGAGNFTIDSAAGTIVNTTEETWFFVNATYQYNHKSENQLASESVTDSSLDSISTYANASSTQFTTLSVSIILILLLAVFAIFWKAFMGGKKKSGTMGGGGQFS